MVEYVCNPSTFEAEAGGSRGINCHLYLPREFEASLGYTKQRKKDPVLLTPTLKLPPP